MLNQVLSIRKQGLSIAKSKLTAQGQISVPAEVRKF
jgi:bifunctional DNA-binding transcriptional regulator/antitoxin component of YhaV-PrlF toxin-antitoxin module